MSYGPHFLLTGKEHLLKKEFLFELRKKFFSGPSNESLNYQEWDASEEGALSEALGIVQTAPFLAEKRLCVLWAVEALQEDDRGKLLRALRSLPSTSVMVLGADATVKKNKFLQELESLVTVVPCHPPFEKDLPVWVETRARKRGGSITRDAARRLLERAGKDISLLQSSLEQLFLYIHPRMNITTADVDALLGRSAEEDIFSIADEVMAKNTASALQKAERLFQEGVRAPEIIGVLAGQFERMKQAADLLERGALPTEVAAALRVHSFYQARFFLQLKKVSKPEIEAAQKKLLETDTMIKQGRLQEKLALEKFILESV